MKSSLKQILNYQHLQFCKGNVILQSGTPNEKKAMEQLKLAEKRFDDDGHSGGSYWWVKQQSDVISNIGWEKWLELDDANKEYDGRGVPLDTLLKEMKRGGLNVKKD